MTAKELKARLSVGDMREIITSMGAEFHYEDDDLWITDTICHHGTKPKLYFYKDTKTFHCYTGCGQMDIISLVIKSKDYERSEVQKAINFICVKLNIDNCEYGFGNQEQLSDWEFINSYKRALKKRTQNNPSFELYDSKILDIFPKIHTQEWIDDGISAITMMKYNILYCVWQQKIVIPHYNVKGELIGIRTRAMLDEDIEVFGKYQPLRIGKKFYNHPLGMNLFGLNHNINAIQRLSKIMLVESEKAVMQADTMFGGNNFTVALCGCNLTAHQRSVILGLQVKEVIIALDKQYADLNSDECKKWAQHIKENIIESLAPFVNVSVLWDTMGLLGYKDSPTDKGKETLLKLMKTKIYVGCNE